MKTIFSLLALLCLMNTASVALPNNDNVLKPTNIQNYVRQVFIQGVPFEQTQQYDASNAPALLTMLSDPLEQAHWANIVVVLEIIGGDEVVQPLIDFIESDPGGVLTHDNYVAKTSALMGMGYLIHRTGNKQALNYLIKSAEPAYWKNSNVTGIVDYQLTLEERDQDMSQYSILGLALSGHQAAASALKQLQQKNKTNGYSELQQQLGLLLDDALSTNYDISKRGLISYYRYEH